MEGGKQVSRALARKLNEENSAAQLVEIKRKLKSCFAQDLDVNPRAAQIASFRKKWQRYLRQTAEEPICNSVTNGKQNDTSQGQSSLKWLPLHAHISSDDLCRYL